MNINVIGFVDDDRGKYKKLLHGKKVLGPIYRIPELIEKFGIKRPIIIDHIVCF